MPLKALSDQVASQMAADIIRTMSAVPVNSPIGFLEITYQEMGDYIPLLGIYTSKAQKKIEKYNGEERIMEFLSADRLDADFQSPSFRPLLALFTDQVSELNNYRLATAMIRKVAKLLNDNKLNNVVPVTENFTVFSVDWSMDGEDFTEILAECGVPDQLIEGWRESEE